MEREIVVRGEGVVYASPDEASLLVVVECEDKNRDRAYAQAATLATAVDAALTRAGDAVSQAGTAAVVVQPTTQWKDGVSVRTGWAARRSTLVTVVALDALSELLAELAAAGAALRGPTWGLRDDVDAKREARLLAVGDARERAETYAQGLGLRLGHVAWVAEPGLRLGEPSSDHGLGTEALAMRDAPTDDLMEVRPGVITVRASVETGFDIIID